MPEETTANYIRVRVGDPKGYTRFRVKTLESGIKAVIGSIKGNTPKIQSILFSRERYNMKSARSWATIHGYKINETLLVYDIIIDPKTLDLSFIEETVTTEAEEENIARPKVKPWAWMLDEDINLTGFDM
jgi:hypothetical protein